MKRRWAVLFLYMRVKAKGKYEYRAAFWLDALSFLFGYGAQTLLMVLLTQKFDTINGWTPLRSCCSTPTRWPPTPWPTRC